jgi:hypothetical protein
MNQILVTGKVNFGDNTTYFDKATAYVSILDVSR